MALHPYAVALVKRLDQKGRAGESPFGVPLSVWRDEIDEETS